MLSAAASRPAASAGAALTVIAALMTERTGQDVLANRAWRIDAVLQPLLRERGLADLDQLVSALTVGAPGRLADAVVEALLNQETSWYRDAGVIELAAQILADRHAAVPARRVRVWSAGCSVGQEPYSLAMALAERDVFEGRAFPEIVATDVSEAAVARARAGRYTQFESQRGLPIRRLLHWFDEADEGFVAKPALNRLVSFRRHNLVTDAPPYGRFDLILCRNVLLYFSGAVRAGVFARLAGALRPGGLLILGAGETTIGQTNLFVPSRSYRGAYEAVAAADDGV